MTEFKPQSRRSYNRKTAREDMNLALDHQLEDRQALEYHLDTSPRERVLWDKLQQVDHLLGSEPMLHAPLDFSSNFMDALAAGKQPDISWDRNDLRTALGLLTVAVVLSPVAIGVMMLAQRVLGDPGSLALFAREFVTLLNSLLAAFNSILHVFVGKLTASELFAAAGLIFLPTVSLVMMLRYYNLLRREPQIIYRIPVVAA